MAKKATIKDFKSWLENLGRFISHKNIEVVINEGDCDGKGNYDLKYKVRIYTDNNSYGIIAHETEDKDYLGCIASSRKPRAGETWTRGRDLADGPLTKETWHRILGDIVSYELVNVHKSTPKSMPDLSVNSEDDVGPSLGEPDEPTGTTGETG